MQVDDSTMAESSEFRAACAVLGVSDAPSIREAKTAFRDRAALLHPDVHQGAGTHRMKAATEAMQQLNDAYQLLLESLAASDRGPTNVTRAHPGVMRRDRSRTTRSHSRRGLRVGREVVILKRRTTQRRMKPLGRLSHVSLWLDG